MRTQLRGLLLCLEELRKFDPEMGVHRASIFLIIGLKQPEGISFIDLGRATDLSSSAVSRSYHSLAKESVGLVEVKADPVDLRRLLAVPTPKGRRVLKYLADTIGVQDDGNDFENTEERQEEEDKSEIVSTEGDTGEERGLPVAGPSRRKTRKRTRSVSR